MNQNLYDELISLAMDNEKATYSDVAPIVGLTMSDQRDRDKLAGMLIEIAIFEDNQNRPMLTSLIVKQGNNVPSEGLFKVAQKLGYFDGSRDEIKRFNFWEEQVSKVYDHWAGA